MTRTAALVLTACLFAGCGGAGSDASGPDTPVTGTPSADPSPIGRGPRVVEAEGGLENVLPTAWTKAKVAPDDMSARLTWFSGVEECYGLDRVEVEYTDTAIDITLFSGSRPEAETCIELAEKVVTVVEFEEPVGGRELVDAARVD